MASSQHTQRSARCVPGSTEGARNKRTSLGCSHGAPSPSRALPGPNPTWQVLGQVTHSPASVSSSVYGDTKSSQSLSYCCGDLTEVKARKPLT